MACWGTYQAMCLIPPSSFTTCVSFNEVQLVRVEDRSLVPRPRFPTAANGLHHRYVGLALSVTQSLRRHKNGVSVCVVIC